ncbi:hypothetical protein ACWCOV_17735 [Kribbella sp. NPDC002412]
MKRIVVLMATLVLAIFGIAATPAFAQSGHFVGTPTCTDEGVTVECSGKVAGLGGTTFEITVVASGVATVECINPAGNRAPGQDTDVTVAGTTTPLPTPRNGQFRFNLESDDPNPLPSTPTCPNNQWTPIITDVAFTDATLTLLEGGVVSDTITVPVT